MSILIKGMEMPTDHPLWIVVHSDGTVEANEVSPSRPVGWQTLRNAAVPVPPHGRLIDADALHEELYALEYARENEWRDGMREARGVDAARVALLDAPTIIPADPAEEGE